MIQKNIVLIAVLVVAGIAIQTTNVNAQMAEPSIYVEKISQEIEESNHQYFSQLMTSYIDEVEKEIEKSLPFQ